LFLATALAGCGSASPSVTVEQVDRQQDGMFALEIRTPQDRYKVGEAIPIFATLMYLGPEPRKAVSGGRPLVTFGLEQIDGPLDMGGGTETICDHHDLAARQPVAVPFVKSGGFSNDDPRAGFWLGYFNDAQLHLPAGSWRMTASLDVIAAPECQGERHRLDASVTFRVEG
jgi:hypothetical protein